MLQTRRRCFARAFPDGFGSGGRRNGKVGPLDLVETVREN